VLKVDVVMMIEFLSWMVRRPCADDVSIIRVAGSSRQRLIG
jgi:hypothetical protein